MEKIDFKLTRNLTDLEKSAFLILKTLKDNGFETYIAGGAVRDYLQNIKPHDIDIATAAKPDEVKRLFPKAEDRGKAFGVVVVNNGGFEFEVATFRTDVGTADHRHPEKVEFTNSEQDAKRRDFTVNALFYDSEKGEIFDFVGGLKDLKDKIIRFVGDADKRIEEDYLRMLRAVRFAFRLKFLLDKETEKAIKKSAKKILGISKERIREELTLILQNNCRSDAFERLSDLGILKVLLPEVEAMKGVEQPEEFHSEGDVWTHALLALKSLKNPTAELAWTVLLHDVGKPETQGFRDHPKSKITFFDHDVQSAEMTKKILKRFKFGNSFVDACVWAISQHMRIIHAFQGMSERKQEKLFTHEHINLLLDLTKADLGASIRPNGMPEMAMYQDAVGKRENFKEKNESEKKQIEKFTLINGNDIIEILKITPGPKVGEIKQQIEDKFLEGKISNRSEALELIKEYKK